MSEGFIPERKDIPVIHEGIVYMPVIRAGIFAGWMLLDVKYFTEQQLQSIKEEAEPQKQKGSV